MDTKNYWFALKSHIYVEFKREKILLYDTHTGNYVKTELHGAIALISQMYEPKNLGVTLLTKEMQADTDIRNFVENVLEKQMGDLTDVEKYPNKPVRLIPILNLQKDVDRLKERGEDSILIGKDTMYYLLELNLFLNDFCTLVCPHCNAYCTQTYCCTANNTNQDLSVEDIENVFRQIQYSSVSKINILGGNILKYPNINKLQKLFDSFHELLHCYFHYKNYEANVLSDSLNLELIVNFPLKEDVFKNTWHMINKEKTTVHFIIENEEQYTTTEQLIDKFNMEKFNIFPFFTGENEAFFQENIFLDKDDLFSKTLSIREIFRNQKLNSNFFGSLFILPDGNVKANLNTQAIGNIKTDSILSLIYKEMLDNTSWRKVRNMQPCNDCVYQWLCPSPSDYELVIGKPNLCHVKP
jgi:pseudo-rSAM protein